MCLHVPTYLPTHLGMQATRWAKTALQLHALHSLHWSSEWICTCMLSTRDATCWLRPGKSTRIFPDISRSALSCLDMFPLMYWSPLNVGHGVGYPDLTAMSDFHGGDCTSHGNSCNFKKENKGMNRRVCGLFNGYKRSHDQIFSILHPSSPPPR